VSTLTAPYPILAAKPMDRVTPLPLSAARTLHLAAQGLLSTPCRKAVKDDVLDAIRRMGQLQIDTIHVVARSPYFVLFSRLGAPINAKAHRSTGVFELKSVHIEPGVRVTSMLTEDVGRAVQRCANWHGTPSVTVASAPPGWKAALTTASTRAAAPRRPFPSHHV
jgi:uncharacterized protein YcaQ